MGEGIESETERADGARQYYQNSRPEILPFLPKNRNRALEIGCGEGYFISTIGGTTETWAVEAHPHVARHAQSRIDNVLVGEFENVRHKLPKKYFDVVICNDVIEHMLDHERFLMQIKSHIAPGGCIVGSIPNVRYYRNLFEFLIEKDWRYRKSGTLDATHLRFFTEKSIKYSLKKADYAVESFERVNPYFDNHSQRDKLYKFLSKITIGLSLGYMSDIAFLQFAFRAVPN